MLYVRGDIYANFKEDSCSRTRTQSNKVEQSRTESNQVEQSQKKSNQNKLLQFDFVTVFDCVQLCLTMFDCVRPCSTLFNVIHFHHFWFDFGSTLLVNTVEPGRTQSQSRTEINCCSSTLFDFVRPDSTLFDCVLVRLQGSRFKCHVN